MRDDSTYTEINDGTKEWYINGKRHREDGPAIIWADGEMRWWIDGHLHREDGPAIIKPNGEKRWYINGEQYDKTDSIFDKAREKYPERFI